MGNLTGYLQEGFRANCPAGWVCRSEARLLLPSLERLLGYAPRASLARLTAEQPPHHQGICLNNKASGEEQLKDHTVSSPWSSLSAACTAAGATLDGAGLHRGGQQPPARWRTCYQIAWRRVMPVAGWAATPAAPARNGADERASFCTKGPNTPPMHRQQRARRTLPGQEEGVGAFVNNKARPMTASEEKSDHPAATPPPSPSSY